MTHGPAVDETIESIAKLERRALADAPLHARRIERDRLVLQIALLTDRKTAKIIALLEELRRDLPTVPDRHDAEAQTLSRTTDPHAVTAELEKRTPNIDEPFP